VAVAAQLDDLAVDVDSHPLVGPHPILEKP